MSITIQTDNLRGHGAPLYETDYDAYVFIRQDGYVYAGTHLRYGAWTADEYHNVTIIADVPNDVSGDALADYLEGKGRPLLEAIHAGHTVSWDTHYSRFEGRLDAAAHDALLRMIQELDELDTKVVIPVKAWLRSSTLRDMWPSNMTLRQAADSQLAEASQDGAVLDGDVQDYLLDVAIRVLGSQPDMLGQRHIDALLAAGRIDEALAQEWAQKTISQ